MKPDLVSAEAASRETRVPLLTRPEHDASPNAYFRINFLKNSHVPKIIRIRWMKWVLGFLVLNAVACVILMAAAYVLRSQIARVRSQTAMIVSASSMRPVDLQDELGVLNVQVNRRQALLKSLIDFEYQDFSVADKLAALAGTLPQRTWIEDLKFARDGRSVTVSAVYLIDSRDPSALPVQAWAATIRSHPLLGNGLSLLDLKKSNRSQAAEKDVYEFELQLRWGQ